MKESRDISPNTTAPSRPRSLLQLLLADLDTQATILEHSEPLLRAFGLWLTPELRSSTESLQAIGREALSDQVTNRGYRTVAVLGFACSRVIADTDLQSGFVEGIEWMQGRRFFVAGQPLSFEADGIAILGIAAGINALKPPDAESHSH